MIYRFLHMSLADTMFGASSSTPWNTLLSLFPAMPAISSSASASYGADICMYGPCLSFIVNLARWNMLVAFLSLGAAI